MLKNTISCFILALCLTKKKCEPFREPCMPRMAILHKATFKGVVAVINKALINN